MDQPRDEKRQAQRDWQKSNESLVREHPRLFKLTEAEREESAQKAREYRSRHPIRAKESYRRWLEKNRDASASRHRSRQIRRYGITPLEYAEMRTRQGGECAICGECVDLLHIDRHHESGRVRGLLCKPCNTLLGMAKESVSTLYNAATYLQYHHWEED